MKKTIILSVMITMCTSLIHAQNVYIPDPVFKDFLVNHWYNPGGVAAPTVYLDANNDGEIQLSEAASYTGNPTTGSFNMGGLGISDLTGIQAFTSIRQVFVNNNQLTSININGCLSLETLDCSGNPIATLNINNPSLQKIDAHGCPQLTSVNVSGNNTLIEFNCYNNPSLASFDLTGLTLEKLNISNNPLLTSFTNVNYPALTRLYINDCGLTSLDVSNYSTLQYLHCQGNQLTSLNLANGNPQSFIQIDATGHPNLTCIKVDNTIISNYLWGGGSPYTFDAWANFDTDCTPPGPCVVNFPDANFKSALLANTAINTNNNNEIECSEAIAYTNGINVDNSGISDFTGIEAFVNITSFSGNNNQADSLNVSNFTSLTSVSCTGNIGLKYLNAENCNALTNVDVSSGLSTGVSVVLNNCTSLTNLNLTNSKINALAIDGCTSLIEVDCSKNQLTTLDVSSNHSLTTLNCSNNQLNTLNTINNTNLSTLNCSKNQLTYLFVALNTALDTLDCSYNNISYLDVHNNALLTFLNCDNNNLSSIAVNNNPVLTTLHCSSNNLPTLDVSNNADLLTLHCNSNLMSDLDVSNNPMLNTLSCNDNNLPAIDVSSNDSLKRLRCTDNNLTTIDLSNNLILRLLDCSNNQVGNLDLSANTELIELNCSHNQLTTLNLQNNTLLFNISCTNNLLTNLDLSNTYVLILSCDSNNLQTLNLANGHNTMAVTLSAIGNSNLTCVQVDDANYSNSNWTGASFNFDTSVSFSENCTVGIKEMEDNNPYVVYPNPTSGILYFSEESNIQVFNAIGEVVYNKKNVSSLDFSMQSSGIYFVSFISSNGQIIQRSKIIKE